MPRRAKLPQRIQIETADKEDAGLLGEGSFGCVFQPKVACQGPEKPLLRVRGRKGAAKGSAKGSAKGAAQGTVDDDSVGKVFFDIQDFRQEMKTSKIAAAVDPEGKSMIVPTASCVTTREAVLAHPAGYLCEKHSENPQMSDSSTLHQLLMPHGGVRLDTYVASQVPFMSSKELVLLMIPVLEGIVKLHAAGQCHQDIKTSNVLVAPAPAKGSAKQGIARLIDYSLLMPLAKIYSYSNRRRWQFSYFPYPPEYKMFYVLHRELGRRSSGSSEKTDSRTEVFSEIRRNWFSFGERRGRAYYDLFGENKIRRLVDEFYEWTMNTAATRAKLETAFAPFADKLDVYSVGMIFVDLSRILSPLETPKTTRAMRIFLRGLSHPDPRERFGPLEALAAAQSLLKAIA